MWAEEEWSDAGLGQDWEVTSCAPALSKAPFPPPGKCRQGMGNGQAVLALDLCGTSPLSLAVVSWGEADGTPRPEGAVGELGGGSSGRGETPGRSVGGRQAPAKHCFQSLLSGRNCSGTIYFPIMTALADGASVAGPKPCSGARFLIRKRI